MTRSRKRTRSSEEEEDPDFAPQYARNANEGARGRRGKTNNNAGRGGHNNSSSDLPIQYRGVTHHIRTNRFEAHLWENGKQLYLGGYDSPQLAALAFDVAAVRYRGNRAETNFSHLWYLPFTQKLNAFDPEVVVAGLRRHSKGESVQSSMFKGVTRHQKGRWEARIGQTAGRKYQYLGLHDSEIHAAKAYDLAAIDRNGVGAATNFHLACYMDDLNEEQMAEAREKGILTDADIQMEMALRSTAGMTEDDVAAMNAIATGVEEEEAKTLDETDLNLVFDPSAAAAAAAAVAGIAAYEQLQKQLQGNNKDGAENCSSQIPPSGPTTEGIEIEMEAAARRFTTYSSEDALAGMLFDTIVSPQTVLPNRAPEAHNNDDINKNITGVDFPEGASATKPKPTRAEALAAALGDLGNGGPDCIDLKNLMSAGAALNECSLPGTMQISPGLLASLSADLECPQEGDGNGVLPVTRALFV
ncbi:hypothetical protein Ndes2526B_g02690 [Nannochloris sp. 'desiccata']|nr:hypothetical protein KSW81_007023 [Chlorella desiccata (nom. nud.)]KAH7621876.1 putative APETALA2-like protein 4 [Chlorella desiccata (nom. nud.)]